ncbi:MAG: hypothetical protein EZS28_014378 [Streblomastix strix]|uniref:Uncharacterized protein n=1 Tax=Streblomastix strix TaxID=222440 RepID=A0A5J4W537_9EUKA|nr:MAG: hypothetical protein EZS28_014378 [Streblomastix strix]
MILIQVEIRMNYEMIQENPLMNYTLSLQVIQTLTSIAKIETKQMACVLRNCVSDQDSFTFVFVFAFVFEFVFASDFEFVFVDPKVIVYVIEGDIESDCDTDQYGTDAYEDNDDNYEEEEEEEEDDDDDDEDD